VQVEEATGWEAQGGRRWRRSRMDCLPCHCYLFHLWKSTSDLSHPRRSGNDRADPAVHVSVCGRRGVHYAWYSRKPCRLFLTHAQDVRSNTVNGWDVWPVGPPYV
jgi:hypothetical protein